MCVKNFNLYLKSALLLCALSACQQNADLNISQTGAANELASDVSLKSVCNNTNQGLKISESPIIGTEGLESGKSAELSLSPDVNCVQAQQATWKIGDQVIGAGTKVKTKINGTGIYMLSVADEKTISSANLKKSESVTREAIIQATGAATTTRVAVTDSTILLVGPQIGTQFNRYTFSLAVPTNLQVQSAEWNFNDGSAIEYSLSSVSHLYSVGTHKVSVKVIDSNQQITNLEQSITILSFGIDCPIDGIDIVGATEVVKGQAMSYSLSSVSCFSRLGAEYTWDFGDGTALASTTNVSHVYDTEGVFNLTASVKMKSDSSALFTLSRTITVVKSLDTNPGPITPDPVDPNACTVLGESRTQQGDLVSKVEACGTGGTQNNTYRDQIIQVCSKVGAKLSWVTQSTTPSLVSRGVCENQSCELKTDVGVQVIKNGESRVLYTQTNPTESCSSVQETRLCQNGVLSGSALAVNLSCQNGCGVDFGAHGTVKVGVVTGEVNQSISCRFNEENIFNVVNQIADKTCENGQIISSNSRLGSIKTEGQCPTYSWVASTEWTTCSENCGGVQSLIYSCKNNQGVVSAVERCDGLAPTEQRVCDGNPEAVRQQSVTTRDEDANSSALCPKNQIGVIVNSRVVTTTTTVACIDHKVQQESQVESATAWQSTSYCRDFVAKRCSQDSLSNAQAAGRFDWMEKCKAEVPLIQEFLDRFNDVSYKGIGLDNTARHLYPTFLDSKTNKPWIAPIKASSSCDVPATAYVAAVCVSSCATPEQQILVEEAQKRKTQAMSFIDALNANIPRVATLASEASLSSTKLIKTPVEQWVTELLDTTQPILTFKMKSGGALRVTLNHPLVAQDGTIKIASQFKVGESMIKLGGRADTIVSIEQSDYYGKVYNLFVKSNDLKRNIVVINGYLSGTAFYQNEGAQYINREILKSKLTEGVFSK